MAATAGPDGAITWRLAPVTGIAELLDGTVAIDMPIGLHEHGPRECDVLLRAQMGRHSSRVFLTPPRAVLEAGLRVPNDDVQALARSTWGSGVSRQALGLAERILVLDAALAGRPDADVVETYPELAFAGMSGAILDRKASARGIAQRWTALSTWLPDVSDVVAQAPAGVPVADALDALACLWSAQRWRAGAARTLPPGVTTRPFVAI